MTATAPPPVEHEVPAELEVERAVLGLFLLDGSLVGPYIDLLPPEAFHDDHARLVWGVITALYRAGHGIDVLTVRAELRRRDLFEYTGGEGFLAILQEDGTVATQLPEYVRLLQEALAKRMLVRVGGQLIDGASNGRPASDLLTELERHLDSIRPAAAPPMARLKVVTWRELTEGEIQPIPYFWPGWISVAAVVLLSAAGESLKSWLAAYLACMAAAGRPAFAEPGTDEAPVQHGPVLYLAGENALAEEKRRCQLLKAGVGLPDDLPISFVDAGGVSLGDEADYAAVVALVIQLRPVLIVLDSAIALSGLARENDNTEVRTFMKRRILPLAREYGATVLLIGHSPKAPTQPGVAFGDEHVARGAGDWRNAADTLLYLRRDRSLGECAVVLKHAKQRIGARHPALWFELQEPEPGRAVRLVYGGRFSDHAQGIQAGVQQAGSIIAGVLKATPDGLYQRLLEEQVLAAGISKASFRRAVAILRGKKPWPYGPLRGKTQAVVKEVRHGRDIHLTLDLTTWPADEDWDDA